MTRIITTDKRTRVNAIPFRGQWFSNLNYGGVGNTLVDGQADGDLRPFSLGGEAQIRICTPAKGDLIEARLTINAVAPDTGLFDFYIYIGEFDTDGITPKTLTTAEKLASWKRLTGFTEPILYGMQDNIYWDGLNLFPELPKRGDAKFNEDAFIIGIECFIKNPPSAPFVLYDFFVDCTTQIAEVRK